MTGEARLLEVATTYWFAVYLLLIAVASINLVSSLDDAIIDVAFWLRRFWRRIGGALERPAFPVRELFDAPQSRIAVLVPAWDEAPVIGKMLDYAVATFDYDNYSIFVGTYPNDPDTARAVDTVSARSAKIRKVVTSAPGPTSKADALNHCIEAAYREEQADGRRFEIFVLHDAEDVVHPLELRLLNRMIRDHDLVQLPVFALEREWWHLTGGHYQDEFAEYHSKDLTVREMLAHQVPSAGVGTGFSRRAIDVLQSEGDGQVFDSSSLTEDYEISFRIRRHGLSEVFVRFPVDLNVSRRDLFGRPHTVRRRTWVAVREYFPDEFWASVRQKSRWTLGIVVQGSRRIPWKGGLALRYFLIRDRKAIVTNLVNVLGYLIVANVLIMQIYRWISRDGYAFPPLVRHGDWVWWLLVANAIFLANRILHRAYFSYDIHGPYEAMLSLPRQIWGNFVNFFAAARAIRLGVSAGFGRRRLTWDKTTHSFPEPAQLAVAERRLGEVLLARHAITESELSDALLLQTALEQPLGQILIDENILPAEDVAAAIAEQHGLEMREVDSRSIDLDLFRAIPQEVALRYGILPVEQLEDDSLVVASEGVVDEAVLADIEKPGLLVRFAVAPRGDVTMALRWLREPDRLRRELSMLRIALARGWLSERQIDELWRAYRRRHVKLGDILAVHPQVDAIALREALEEFAHDGDGSVGDWLLRRGVVSRPVLNDAMVLQDRSRTSVAQTAAELGLINVRQAAELQRRAA